MKTTFYTGKGDKGKSSLGKKKISKDDVLFHALGTLDELNTWLGLCKVATQGRQFDDVRKQIHGLQENMFVAQAEIAAIGMGVKPKILIKPEHTRRIEKDIEKIDKIVPPLNNFIIPGGSELATRIDVARTISRRLERTIVGLSRKYRLSKDLRQYLNRLSSILFALTQLVNHKLKIKREHPRYNRP